MIYDNKHSIETVGIHKYNVAASLNRYTFPFAKKAQRSAKQLLSDVINASACVSCWQQQSG